MNVQKYENTKVCWYISTEVFIYFSTIIVVSRCKFKNYNLYFQIFFLIFFAYLPIYIDIYLNTYINTYLSIYLSI